MMPQVDAKVVEFRDQMEGLPLGDLKTDINKLVGQLKTIRVELDIVNETAKKLSQYQSALQMEPTQFEKLEAFQMYFSVYEKLWLGRKDWMDNYDKWLTQQIFSVDMDDMANIIERL